MGVSNVIVKRSRVKSACHLYCWSETLLTEKSSLQTGITGCARCMDSMKMFGFVARSFRNVHIRSTQYPYDLLFFMPTPPLRSCYRYKALVRKSPVRSIPLRISCIDDPSLLLISIKMPKLYKENTVRLDRQRSGRLQESCWQSAGG